VRGSAPWSQWYLSSSPDGAPGGSTSLASLRVGLLIAPGAAVRVWQRAAGIFCEPSWRGLLFGAIWALAEISGRWWHSLMLTIDAESASREVVSDRTHWGAVSETADGLVGQTDSVREGTPAADGPGLRGQRPSAAPDEGAFGSWDRLLAQIISQVCSPPILGAGAVIVAAFHEGTRRAALWTVAYILAAVLVPSYYIFRLLREGRVSDMEIQIREQRSTPMVFSALALGVAAGLLRLGQAPKVFVVLGALNCALSVVLMLVTLRWKISVHSAVAGAVAVGAWVLFGTPVPLIVGVPVVWWSRWRLHRHTWMQAMIGSAVGVALSLGAWHIAGWFA